MAQKSRLSGDDDDDDNGFAAWGGYMAAKKKKLEQQFQQQAEATAARTDIFAGVAIFVNGYTVPSADELKRLMALHGGTYHHYQSKKTTHVIASNLPDCKVKAAGSLKVVRPQWVTDSVRAGYLLDHRQYLLYGRGNALTAAGPEFLSEFYRNSRLHHISTMGAAFKRYVARLREESTGVFPGRNRLVQWMQTAEGCCEPTDEADGWNGGGGACDSVIMHIDMDCFFVSVGMRDRPDLRGRPVAVAHARGQGRDGKAVEAAEVGSMSEIASCNYEARKYGLRNGMLLGRALQLCPSLETMSYNFEGYQKVSCLLYDMVASYTTDIEAVSCDEMFVDCGPLLKATGAAPLQFAKFLRQEIKAATRCPCSAGFGSNPLQARLATKRAKPDGQYHLQPPMVETFMATVKVADLPGVGPALAERLDSQGIVTCADLHDRSLTWLKSQFGAKTGETLFNHCRGQDDRKLAMSHQRKSVSAEVNYGIRFSTRDEAEVFLEQLAGEVHSRLCEVGMKGRCITLKLLVRAKEAPVQTAKFLGHGECDCVRRTVSLSVATAAKEVIAREVVRLARQLAVPAVDLRGVGIQVTRLVASTGGNKVLTDFFGNNSSATKSHPVPAKVSPPGNVCVAQASSSHVTFTKPPEDKSLSLDTVNVVPSDRTLRKEQVTREPSAAHVPGLKLSPEEARRLIREWVSAEDKPRPWDVELIENYMQHLVTAHRVTAANAVLKQLAWCVHQKNCPHWQAIYTRMLNAVQASVQATYGASLKT